MEMFIRLCIKHSRFFVLSLIELYTHTKQPWVLICHWVHIWKQTRKLNVDMLKKNTVYVRPQTYVF